MYKYINSKGYGILEDPQSPGIIKVVNKYPESKQKLSEKYAKKLSLEVADKLQKKVTQSRAEWNNRSI